MRIEKDKFKEAIDNCFKKEFYSETNMDMDELLHEIFYDSYSLYGGMTIQKVALQLDRIMEYLDSKSKEGNIKEILEKEFSDFPELKKIIYRVVS